MQPMAPIVHQGFFLEANTFEKKGFPRPHSLSFDGSPSKKAFFLVELGVPPSKEKPHSFDLLSKERGLSLDAGEVLSKKGYFFQKNP